MQPASFGSHRAFMISTLTLAVVLIFGLYFGWTRHFQRIEHRKRLMWAESGTSVRYGDTGDDRTFTARQGKAEPKGASSTLTLGKAMPQGAEPGPGALERLNIEFGKGSVENLTGSGDPSEMEKGMQLIAAYRSLSDWRQRSGLVWNVESVRPRMRDYYEVQRKLDPVISELNAPSLFRIGGRELMHVTCNGSRPSGVVELALRRDNEGAWKLDWESFVGYGEMSFAALSRERPTEPVLMRVFAKRSDYYNYEFTDSRSYISLQIISPDGGDSAFAYCRRDGELSRSIEANLADSKVGFKAVTVEVAFPENAESGSCMWLKDLVAPRWLLDE